MFKNSREVVPGVWVTVQEPYPTQSNYVNWIPTYAPNQTPASAVEDSQDGFGSQVCTGEPTQNPKPYSKYAGLIPAKISRRNSDDDEYVPSDDPNILKSARFVANNIGEREPQQGCCNSGCYTVNPDNLVTVDCSPSTSCQIGAMQFAVKPEYFHSKTEPMLQTIPEEVVAQPGYSSWINQVDKIQTQVRGIQESMEYLNDERTMAYFESGRHSETFQTLESLIPLKNLADLELLMKIVKDEKMKSLLISKLYVRDGNNIKDFVRGILSKFISDEIACNFSWRGSKTGKESFARSPLKAIVFDTVRNNRNFEGAPETPINEAIKVWLKSAKKRITSKQLPFVTSTTVSYEMN